MADCHALAPGQKLSVMWVCRMAPGIKYSQSHRWESTKSQQRNGTYSQPFCGDHVKTSRGTTELLLEICRLMTSAFLETYKAVCLSTAISNDSKPWYVRKIRGGENTK